MKSIVNSTNKNLHMISALLFFGLVYVGFTYISQDYCTWIWGSHTLLSPMSKQIVQQILSMIAPQGYDWSIDWRDLASILRPICEAM